MKYMGSKSRIAKSIAPILQEAVDKMGGAYWEPFCGGCNMIDKIRAPKRYATDYNKYLIAMWRHLLENRDAEYPEEITKEEYADVRAHKENYPDWYVGYVGFLASYNGKFFGGYAGRVKTKVGTVRNYYDEARRNVFAQLDNLAGVKFSTRNYVESHPNGLVIYCDPPYENTTGYATGDFDHKQFWQIMREWSKNNVVFISEENAPDDFVCVWEQEVKRTQNNAERKVATEKLFRYRM